METYMLKMNTRSKMEELYEWNKWRVEIPYLQFKSEWGVKVIPPSTGAVVRFVVKYKENQVSVYLDCYDELGFVGEPYWEIYPDADGHNSRFFLHETEDLLEEIEKSLNKQEEK